MSSWWFGGMTNAHPYQQYHLAEAPKKKEQKKEQKKEEDKEYVLWDQEAYDQLHGRQTSGPKPAAPPVTFAHPITPMYWQPGVPLNAASYMPIHGMPFSAPSNWILPAQTTAPAKAKPKAMPTAEDSFFWVKELDGSWTHRNGKEIAKDCQPGKWEYAEESGYPLWIRAEKK